MLRKYVHLLILPVMLTVLLIGCSPVQTQALEPEQTGGIRILKTDALGRPLSEARYRVARKATPQEENDSSIEKGLLKYADTYITVVYVSFCSEAKNCMEAETNEDGELVLSGLPYGTYYLVETQAPQGYERMHEPVRMRIHKYSHLTKQDDFRDDNGLVMDNTLHIVTLGTLIGETGETKGVMSVTVFVAAVFSGLSAMLLLLRKVL